MKENNVISTMYAKIRAVWGPIVIALFWIAVVVFVIDVVVIDVVVIDQSLTYR